MVMNNPYEQVREFHQAFRHPINDKPTAMDKETALKRAAWTTEEVVEFLYATVSGNKDEFHHLVDQLHESIEKTREKIIRKNEEITDVVVAQADALTDISYFNYGSFTIMGVEPQPLFDIVQQANMGKLWDDGKARYREEDGKIIKPPMWEKNFAPEPKIKAEIDRQSKL
ncbi:HAD family hydrolase [Virgibacillus dakarensis]|nr:HAD family hydrolase [Virgibacillus dakarensis]